MSAFPVSASTGTNKLVGAMSLLAKTTSGTSCRCESTKLSVLVHGVDDPVVSGVIADRRMLRIHENDLEVRMGSVLSNPVGVKNTHVGVYSSDTLL